MEKHDDDGQQGQQQPQGSSHQAPEQSAQHAKPPEAPPAVRFASKVEEYDPEQGRSSFEPTKPAASPEPQEATPEQIQALSNTLKLQGERMKNYSFEPFSLPPSRVPSHEDSPSATPQHTHTHSPAGRQSPAMSPRPEIASPPLTPAGTSGPESSGSRSLKPGHANEGTYDTPQAITPQASGQGGSAPVSPRIPLPHRPRSEEPISRQRPASGEQDRGAGAHRRGMFSVGPSGAGSVPGSRESSPSRLSASQFYSRPFTPAGDVNDPYAANKRIPQSKNAGHIDQRFVFSRKKGRASPGSSTTSLHKTEKSEKRHSGLLGVLNKSNHDLQHTGTESTSHSRHSSMTDLRRFFKVGGSSKSIKKTASPGGSKLATSSSRASVHQVPFAEDHGLTSKYGKIGKVLGSGAGGSVKLMRRNEDNTVFAVKEFRPRHTYESEKEYVKKLTAEFCVGSALHHGNIIETLDIVQEKGKWYEVMEYAPYDLFAIVMTGKMSKQEITCCFLQILSGVTYLHSMGLAHRDLKLDNVVVSEHGIIKIIDFGSAHVFSYPFESGIVPASGIVGSDPYLAPEVYEERKYDPQAVDIWSLAIIFCCMSLRRFPWKVPRMSDNSYKLFASEPTPGHDPKKLVLPTPRTTGDAEKTPQQVSESEKEKEKVDDKQGQQEQKKSSQPEKSEKSEKPEAPVSTSAAASSSTQGTQGQKEVIRGPWRLLRLLPRESRHIIGRMLTINPRERAKMSDILEEPWVSDTVICRQIAPGQVINAEDHTHILEPPAPSK